MQYNPFNSLTLNHFTYSVVLHFNFCLVIPGRCVRMHTSPIFQSDCDSLICKIRSSRPATLTIKFTTVIPVSSDGRTKKYIHNFHTGTSLKTHMVEREVYYKVMLNCMLGKQAVRVQVGSKWLRLNNSMLSGSLFTIAWYIFKLWIEETASRNGGQL